MPYIVIEVDEEFDKDDIHVFVIHGKGDECETEKNGEKERQESFS